VELAQLQVHFGKLRAIAAKHRRQSRKHARSNETDSQEPNFSAPDAAGLFQVVFNLTESSACLIKEAFTCARQLYCA